MRIVFFGNHTTGVRTLRTILKHEEIVGVIAHPPDPEDGVCYESVYDFAKQQGLNVVRLSGKDPALEDFVRACKPHLLWVTDIRYIIPPSVFTIPPLGAINLHGSLLPKYRGRAANNWAIINGETQLGLTAHFIDEGVDTGDIIQQIAYEITEEEDAGDALKKLYPLFEEMTDRVLDYFHSGSVPRRKQDESEATAFPRRTAEDGLIDWSQSALHIRNLVRAVARPYPGAFTFCDGKKFTIWKARVESDGYVTEDPGTILSVDQNRECTIACGEGMLRAIDVSYEGDRGDVQVGRVLVSSVPAISSV